MAFTIEEIENKLVGDYDNQNASTRGLNPLRFSPNYATVVDYLTGKIASLPASLQPNDGDIHSFALLISLLDSVDIASANNSLVLDVINHPDIKHYVKPNFYRWLFICAFNTSSESGLQVILQQFRAQGFNDDQIVSFFLTSTGHIINNNSLSDSLPVKKFLLDYVKNTKKLLSFNHGAYWGGSWSKLYFILLDEVKPELVMDYLIPGLHSNNLIPFFIDYRNGHYIPGILTYLQDNGKDNRETLQAKFNAAIQLYEADSNNYSALLIEMSIKYIEYYIQNKINDKWESGFHLSVFDKTEMSYMPYSSCAFYFYCNIEQTKHWLS